MSRKHCLFCHVAVCILFLILFSPALLHAQILSWQLNGAAGNEVSVPATTLQTGLLTSALGRGSGLNPSGLVNAFSSTNFTANGDKADAIANGRFIHFTVQAATGYSVSLQTLNARFRRSATGPNVFRWQYSIDGTAFFDAGVSDISYTGTATGGNDQSSVDLSGIAALQNVPHTTLITFRLLGWGASATTGTFAIGRSATSDPADVSLALSGTLSASLAAPVATPATVVTQNEFTANWDPVPGVSVYRFDAATSPLFTSSQSLISDEGFDGGTTPPAGWTFTGIGGTYTTAGNFGAASPSLRMDATGNAVTTPMYGGSATQLSFWIKGQGTNAASALLVEGYNGSGWITIENITNSIPTTGTVITYNGGSTPVLPAGLKRFRFTYSKSSGNLAVDGCGSKL